MIEGLNIIQTNLSFTVSDIILLLTALGCIVFFAKDVKLGLVMLFLCAGGNFMLNYAMEWDYTKSISLFFVAVVALALSLYFVDKTTQTGGVI